MELINLEILTPGTQKEIARHHIARAGALFVIELRMGKARTDAPTR